MRAPIAQWTMVELWQDQDSNTQFSRFRSFLNLPCCGTEYKEKAVSGIHTDTHTYQSHSYLVCTHCLMR